MNWSLFLKYLGYAFVISVYGLFCWTGRAPVDGFIAVLTGVLALLGGSHLASSAAKDSADTAIKLVSAGTVATSAPPSAPVSPPLLPTSVTKE
ncbi:MAG: hypothetical protein ACRYG5_06645 [Janthinobacterium lividum]